MKILDNNGKTVFSGDWYPSAVTVFFKEYGDKEESVLAEVEYLKFRKFLKNEWLHTDHRERPFSSFVSMFPWLMDMTGDDSILFTGYNWYRIPWEMEDDDSPEAWAFWQNILEDTLKGYKLVNDEN